MNSYDNRQDSFSLLEAIPISGTLRDYATHMFAGQTLTILPTHYHDDHMTVFNLLRDVDGTECWAAENFSDILENLTEYDLPCPWYDPIPVDGVLPLETPIEWEEYTFTLRELSGNIRYAVAIELPFTCMPAP